MSPLPLRTLRVQAGLTQRELATRAGIHYSTVSHIERGRSVDIHPSTRRVLADALDVAIQDVWEFTRDLPDLPTTLPSSPE